MGRRMKHIRLKKKLSNFLAQEQHVRGGGKFKYRGAELQIEHALQVSYQIDSLRIATDGSA